MKLSEIINYLRFQGIIRKDFELDGEDSNIKGFSPITETKADTISWMRSQNIDFRSVKSKIVICSVDLEPPKTSKTIYVRVRNPRMVFAMLVRFFESFEIPAKKGIEETAIIASSCKLGRDIYIGHYTIIEGNVEVGDGTRIMNHVIIHRDSIIGQNCVIGNGVVVGVDGFGYEKDEKGYWFKFPQIGNVIIEDSVEISDYTSIERGTLTSTIIRKNTKIDQYCQIGHNTDIGENCLITAMSLVAGKTKIGKNSYIAPGSLIRNSLEVGESAFIGMGAVVVKDVVCGDTVVGVPAKSFKKKEEN